MCACGGVLSLSDNDDSDATATPDRTQAVATKIAAPVASEPTEEPSPSESSEPEASETPSPTPTVDADEAACVKRFKRSAAAVYFDEDDEDMCAYVPDFDFGVSATNYDRCVKRSRKYHVEKYMYQSTCRYDHTYQWTKTDDPNYDYSPDVPDYDEPLDDPDLSDDPHAGCTWVDSYYRKDGTHVSGYYRC